MFKRLISLITVFVIAVNVFAVSVFAQTDYSPVVPASSYSTGYGGQLNSNAKEIYTQLVEYYQSDKNTGKFVYKLSSPIKFYPNSRDISNDSAFLSAKNTVFSNISAALDAFSCDCPDVYWIRGGNYSIAYTVSSGSSGTVGKITEISFTPNVFNINSVSDFYNSVDDTVSYLKSELKTATRYERVKQIHDYVCQQLSYYYSSSTAAMHSSAAMFLNITGNNAVCEGYAKSFKVLCDRFDIDCLCVTGIGNTNQDSQAHMWNYVLMEDNKWYLVDATWNDQRTIRSTYLLTGANEFGFYDIISNDHIATGKVSDDGVAFSYPNLSAEHYHTYIGVLKPATTTTDGTSDLQCSMCGKEIVVDVIRKASKISLSKTKFVYNGKTQKPTVTVKDSSGKTINSGYYTVSIPSSKKMGVYTIKIKLGGLYKGSVSLKYYIAPVAVKNFSATTAGYNSIKLDWKKQADVTGYQIYRATSKTGIYKKIATVKGANSVSYTDKSLAVNKSYYYKIRAYKTTASNTGAFCKVVSAKTSMLKTTLSSVKNVTGKKVSLTWKKQAGVTGYQIYRATGKNGKYSLVKTTTGASKIAYTNTKLTKNKTYYYKVRAYKKIGSKTYYGSFSSVKSVKITK